MYLVMDLLGFTETRPVKPLHDLSRSFSYAFLSFRHLRKSAALRILFFPLHFYFQALISNPTFLSMATVPLSVPSIKGLRLSPLTLRRSQTSYSKPLVVKAATVIAPKFTSIKPVGNRVLVKIKSGEDKTSGGLYLPTTAQTKSQEGEVVALGDGATVGGTKVDFSVKEGNQVVYSKYAGTELEFHGINHLLMKEDDIVGILESDDIKDLKPLGDRVLIKIAEAEEKTAGGLILTEQAKEKPSIGTVVAVGPGSLDEDGKRKPIDVSPGSTVMYSKYAGSEFKSADGTDYIALRVSDVMAVLSS
ncbi:20 kDa chaperonin [Rhynchospora pubera]|uniref:20 kDa chaperonin, chloroplastic n=1 Tax=Rhynchospora pubera TaxID=906938 RepID=A0AAV8CMM0_9POAL|nr:20 kDa chaperonin [Rhynchospora pubera]